jgi:hypothetical protein
MPSVPSAANLASSLPQAARGRCRSLLAMSRLLRAIGYCTTHSNARPITPQLLPDATCSIAVVSLSVEPLCSSVSTCHRSPCPDTQAPVTAAPPRTATHPFCSSTYTSARLGYLKSALSSRCSIHALRNLLPLTCTLASYCATASGGMVREGCQDAVHRVTACRHGVSSQ